MALVSVKDRARLVSYLAKNRELHVYELGDLDEADRWLAVAGVHVFSCEYKVAALGNIVTAEDARRRGLATKVTAALCRKLLAKGMETIGLNVMRDNEAALECYRKLGFQVVAEYEELLLEAR